MLYTPFTKAGAMNTQTTAAYLGISETTLNKRLKLWGDFPIKDKRTGNYITAEVDAWLMRNGSRVHTSRPEISTQDIFNRINQSAQVPA